MMAAVRPVVCMSAARGWQVLAKARGACDSSAAVSLSLPGDAEGSGDPEDSRLGAADDGVGEGGTVGALCGCRAITDAIVATAASGKPTIVAHCDQRSRAMSHPRK